MDVSWKVRVKHLTWTYFTLTMATGGVANVLSFVPFRFRGLDTIGFIIFIANLVLFVLICALMIARFALDRRAFGDSLANPRESLFAPAIAVSFGMILITIIEYGSEHTGSWLPRAILYMFWINAAFSVLLSISIYLNLWSTQSFAIAEMTPIWLFPAYPLLLLGPLAGSLSAKLSVSQTVVQVIIGGFTIQGIGFIFSLTIYSAFIYRLMTLKLPSEDLRPGMFVSVGPLAFTSSGLLSMATSLQRQVELTSSSENLYAAISSTDISPKLGAQILHLLASWSALWLYGAALWFFFISLLSNAKAFVATPRPRFAMTWFSFIFPQTALTGATFRLADAFQVFPMQIIGTIMAWMLVAMWLFLLFLMIRAIYLRRLLWPDHVGGQETSSVESTQGAV